VRRLRSDNGFALVELLVAITIAAVGLVALAGTFDTSRSSVSESKEMQAASHAGQDALEQVMSLGYSSIALNAAPAASTDQYDPNYFVVGGTPPAYRWNGPTGGSSTEPLVIDSSAGFSSGPLAWGDSRYGGSIYRYVTWACDTAVSGATGCPATNDYKRVTVAVTLKTHTTRRRPIFFQSFVSDPDAGPKP